VIGTTTAWNRKMLLNLAFGSLANAARTLLRTYKFTEFRKDLPYGEASFYKEENKL
jgi:hypothetical protein